MVLEPSGYCSCMSRMFFFGSGTTCLCIRYVSTWRTDGMHMCLHAHVCVYIYIYIYICMCVYIYTHIHIYIYIYEYVKKYNTHTFVCTHIFTMSVERRENCQCFGNVSSLTLGLCFSLYRCLVRATENKKKKKCPEAVAAKLQAGSLRLKSTRALKPSIRNSAQTHTQRLVCSRRVGNLTFNLFGAFHPEP